MAAHQLSRRDARRIALRAQRLDRQRASGLVELVRHITLLQIWMAELFGFEYVLEMYKPAAKRRWGYFALPILYEDRLVGQLDAIADRRAGALRVHALHWDVEPGAAMRRAVDREIDDLARWLDVSRAQAA